MEITNHTVALAAGASTPTAAGAKMDQAAAIKTHALPDTPTPGAQAGCRGPKVLQSRQARQRCFEFSRG